MALWPYQCFMGHAQHTHSYCHKQSNSSNTTICSPVKGKVSPILLNITVSSAAQQPPGGLESVTAVASNTHQTHTINP